MTLRNNTQHKKSETFVIMKKSMIKQQRFIFRFDRICSFPSRFSFWCNLNKHENSCRRLQTNKCKNNQCSFLNLECRQTFMYFTDNTFAVYLTFNLCFNFAAFKVIFCLKNHLFWKRGPNFDKRYIKTCHKIIWEYSWVYTLPSLQLSISSQLVV